MLHEVLMTVIGHNGAFFKDTVDGIKIVKDLPFISDSESAIIDHLCGIATHYKRFVTFINHHYNTLSRDEDTTGLHGLYLKSLCQGLDDVLQPYRQTVVDLEQCLLSQPDFSLCLIHNSLMQFELLFIGLSSLLTQIESQKAHGCYILDLLYRHCQCGVSVVPAVSQ